VGAGVLCIEGMLRQIDKRVGVYCLRDLEGLKCTPRLFQSWSAACTEMQQEDGPPVWLVWAMGIVPGFSPVSFVLSVPQVH
jgi:hypothetical protein